MIVLKFRMQNTNDHLSLFDMSTYILVHTAQGKYAEADPLYIAAIDIAKKYLDPDHPDFAVSISCRAQLLQAQVWSISHGAFT